MADWKGKLEEKSAQKGIIREMSEPHDFDPADFQAGAFAVGAQYASTLSAKETKGNLIEIGWSGELEEVG